MKQSEGFKNFPADTEDILPKFSEKDISTKEKLDSSARMWLINHYSKTVLSFSTLQKEYDRSKSESHSSAFPSMEDWTPPDRVLSDQEKLMLLGPTLEVENFLKVELCLPVTRRWVTCSSAKYEQSLRISSSYVAVKNNHDNIPQFGRIGKLFLHSFVDNTTVVCEVVLFAPPNYDEETKMWYTSSKPQNTALHLLKDLTIPLVTGHNNAQAQVWFLNY